MIGIQLPYMFKKKGYFTSPSLDCAYNVNKDLTFISCYKKIKIEWMFTKCKSSTTLLRDSYIVTSKTTCSLPELSSDKLRMPL